MTRKQIDELLKIHTSQRDFAKSYLDQYYYDLEANNHETEWLNRYIKHKKIVEQLTNEKADDE